MPPTVAAILRLVRPFAITIDLTGVAAGAILSDGLVAFSTETPAGGGLAAASTWLKAGMIAGIAALIVA